MTLPVVNITAPAGVTVNLHPTTAVDPPPDNAGIARALGSWSGFAFGDYARPDYSGITFDAARNRALFGLGGGHQSNPAIGKDTNIIALPMTSKTWAPLYPSMTQAEIEATTIGADGLFVSTKQAPARHTYNGTIVLGNWFCVLTNGGSSLAKPCRYDLVGNLGWQEIPPPTDPANAFGFLTAVAPTVDGRALIASYSGGNWGMMHLYEPSTNTTTKIGVEGTFGAWGSTAAFAYFPPNGKFYFLRNDYALFEYTFNPSNPAASTSREVSYTGPRPDAQYLTLSYDAISHTLGGCVAGGTYWAVDPVAGVAKKAALVVETGSSGVPNTLFHCAARDPVSNRLYALDAGVTWEISPPTF